MKHFHRTSVHPDAVLAAADAFFPGIGLRATASSPRSRAWEGTVGTPDEPARLTLTVRMEGGHYTFIEADTTAMGESRLDRNVKKFFVQVHRMADPRHAVAAAY
jgi:hypothetical protein